MNTAGNLVLNHYVAALSEIQKLENRIDNMVAMNKRFTADLMALKKGEKSLQELIVTDDGYAFLPPEPEEEEDTHDDASSANVNGHAPAQVG